MRTAEHSAQGVSNDSLQRVLKDAAFVLALCLLAFYGWRVFYFWTDDAFIAFRYVRNAVDGHGLVWNPAPFMPVEGYSSFLWVLLHYVFWKALHLPPTDVANGLSLCFGLGSVALTWVFLKRIAAAAFDPRERRLLCFAAALFLVCNRTFLTWLSSGLETSMFNFFFLWWIYEVVFSTSRASLFRMSLATALAVLTRPDGLIFLPGALLLLGLDLLDRAKPLRRRALGFAPLLLPLAHELWRLSFYGEPLPNTYYAKSIAPWPEMGIAYLTSFVLEHGLYVWLLLLLACVVVHARKHPGQRFQLPALRVAIPIATVLGHVLYYLYFIGGDHFEYRVFACHLPFVPLVAVWACGQARISGERTLVALLILLLASLPIPYTHWWLTKDMSTRNETMKLVMPIHGRFSFPMNRLAAYWDDLQERMITRFVCVRHQEHKILFQTLNAVYPSFEEGRSYPWKDRVVLVAESVGVSGYNLNEVAIIDFFGLNDWVVARSPKSGAQINMAHDRLPPIKYVLCFSPNAQVDKQWVAFMNHVPMPIPAGVARVKPRLRLTEAHDPSFDERIVECERSYRAPLR